MVQRKQPCKVVCMLSINVVEDGAMRAPPTARRIRISGSVSHRVLGNHQAFCFSFLTNKIGTR